MAQRIILKNHQSPGDYVVMTAAIRDLHRTYPGRFEVMASTLQDDVFTHNPHTMRFAAHPGVKTLPGTYSNRASKYSIHNCGAPDPRTHFLWAYIGDLNLQLKTDVRLTEFRPDLHLTEEEMSTPLIPKPYWVFASGGKKDFTAKWWDPAHWQAVIDSFPETKFVQVGGGGGGLHVHPTIRGVHDLVKRTTFRELMRLIYHSEGVLCIVTCLMHIAAAFNKPCVVIAGGREPNWWEAYTAENRLHNMRQGFPNWKPESGDSFVPHQYLHTMGQLPCCTTNGCWKSRVVRLDPKDTVCTRPVQGPSATIPECMRMITPQQVISSVNWYYEQGILGKGAPRKVVLPPVVAFPETPKPVAKRATVLLLLDSQSPQRLQTVEALRKQDIEDAAVKVLLNGVSAPTGSACLKHGWKVLEFPVPLSRAELVNAALREAEGFTALVEESSLPDSPDWLWKLKERAGKACVGTVKWRAWKGRREDLQVHPLIPDSSQVKCLDLGLLAGESQAFQALSLSEDDPELSLGLHLAGKGVTLRNVRMEEL